MFPKQCNSNAYRITSIYLGNNLRIEVRRTNHSKSVHADGQISYHMNGRQSGGKVIVESGQSWIKDEVLPRRRGHTENKGLKSRLCCVDSMNSVRL